MKSELEMFEVQQVSEVYVVWTNTDLTEGRGCEVIKSVCETMTTARRVGKKGYVQGSDCPISKGFGLKINGTWYYQGHLSRATKEDIAAQSVIDAREAAFQKAKDAGLTDDDLAAIIGVGGNQS